MQHINDPKWLRVFGTVWQMIIATNPDVGGFLVDHRSKEVSVDSNVMKMTQMHFEPAYDELMLFLQALTDQVDSNLAVFMVEDNVDITAGIIRRVEVDNVIADSLLPVCPQSQLVITMSEMDSSGVLVLLKVEKKNGVNLSDDDITAAVYAIKKTSPQGSLLSTRSRDRYWLYVPEFDDDITPQLEAIRDAVEKVSPDLTMSAGIGADLHTPGQIMHSAEFTLFEASSIGKGVIRQYSVERYEKQKQEFGIQRIFSQLIDRNLFNYHFQPIVSAFNGDIIGYEALMRTGKDIGMYPREILDAATKYNRLYDIEKATLGNTLSFISKNQDYFKDRKLFVNSISATMLTDDDWDLLVNEYGELMEKMVIELTEQTEMSDEILSIIQRRLRENKIKLSIDDYGTGYSNTSNLLRYSPDYVKIDRSLISGIDDNLKMQKFISSIIEFVHDNGYLALAEGVETYEELKTMIQLGADLIQGFYISRPKPVMLLEISETVRDEIMEINHACATVTKVYHPKSGETVSMQKLIENHYTSIFIESERVTIEGGSEEGDDIVINIKDELEACITLRNVNLCNLKDDPTISLGKKSNIELKIESSNVVKNKGILVPQSASLKLTGNGTLKVLAEATNSFCIGTSSEQAPGNIVLNMTGKLEIEANGERCIGIGGGKNPTGNAIAINGGEIDIHCAGDNCLGIGIYDGNAVIDAENARFIFDILSPNCVGIGSMVSDCNIVISNYLLNFNMSGINICGAGVLDSGRGKITLLDGKVDFTMRGRRIACIGTHDGSVDCSVSNSHVILEAEGACASGIGDYKGAGDVNLTNTTIDAHFMSKENRITGSRDGVTTVSGGSQNARINE